MKYKRIMLKLSGEGLSSKDERLAIDPTVVNDIAIQVKELVKRKIEVAIVVGGGNFWRGASAAQNGIDRNKADYIGMLATIMNALALQSSFEKVNLPTKVLSAITMEERVVESYSHDKAVKYLNEKNVVIFAGGTGRPFFTTDTAASLVATELGVDVILMAKNGINGVYDSDPKINKNAKRFEKLYYDEVLAKGLKALDLTASAMARENDINTIVFNIMEQDAIINVIDNKTSFTLISRRKEV